MDSASINNDIYLEVPAICDEKYKILIADTINYVHDNILITLSELFTLKQCLTFLSAYTEEETLNLIKTPDTALIPVSL
ncbi:MAG: hypothetical protein L3V56_02090 [Candidatus Magnetoovum sp. WYHC-5]|nr:hypothetical protein [Candidatus Magnetoovum sp. WYHC-5]